jgi:hypothetical protein
MDSTVRAVFDAEGHQLGAAWLRKLRGTGQTAYSGWYGSAELPNRASASIRVVFPLPHGCIAVFLRPENGDRGALRLTSPLGQFGDVGAYLIVADDNGKAGWVRRVPLAEQFTVYVDEEGVPRIDHALDLWHLPVMSLHSRLDPLGQPPHPHRRPDRVRTARRAPTAGFASRVATRAGHGLHIRSPFRHSPDRSAAGGREEMPRVDAARGL